jgi:hypothetical protein
LTLRTEAIGAAVKGWPLGLFGLISILLLTPSFSRLIMLVQLQPRELVTGYSFSILNLVSSKTSKTTFFPELVTAYIVSASIDLHYIYSFC